MLAPMEGTGRDRGSFWIAAAAANGFVAVAMGAFAAHGLKAVLDPEALGWVKTGADYQLWHGLALLGIGILAAGQASPWLSRAGFLMLSGVVLFSGSLYAMALGGWRGFALATPVGGTLLLLGWLALFLHALSRMRAGA